MADEPGGYFKAESVEFFTSGTQVIDCMLGGGWAGSRVLNVVGDYSSGKTLLALEACANHLAKWPDGHVTYCDVERALDESYTHELGIDLDKFERKYFQTVEDWHNHLFEALNAIPIGSKTHNLWVIDSLDALSSDAEKGRPIDEATYGGEKAKKLSELFRRLNQDCAIKNMTVLVISQIRDLLAAGMPAKTRSGGKALDFYASQVVWLYQKGKIERTVKGIKRPVGIKVQAKCRKNKVGIPFRECDIEIIFGRGVDDITSNLQFLESAGKLGELPIVDGVKPAQISSYVKKIWAQPREDMFRTRSAIADFTKITWDQVEEGFRPDSPTKY